MQQLSQNGLPNDTEHYSLIKIYMLPINWIPLLNEQQLEELKRNSAKIPQVIFKHSSRCSISSMARSRLERSPSPDGVDFYFLDIINHRNISNKIAADFRVHHESPQILIINDGNCVYNESHSGIDMQDIIANTL